MRSLNVLIGMESSGVVRSAFRRLGHNAVSCDFLASELPGPHYQGNVWDIIHSAPAFGVEKWDLGIFHPTCTNMCNSGSKHLYIGKKKENGPDEQRWAAMRADADPIERRKWAVVHRASPGPDRWKDRSRTRQGPADAMAAQWGGWATGIQAALIRIDQAAIDLMEVTSACPR